MIQNFSTTSFVIGVMVGVILSGAWFLRGDTGLNFRDSSSFFATSTDSFLLNNGAVSVANQPSGDSVMVESVTVQPPGVWVAVREMNGRDLGNVLGASRVVGLRDNVEVALLRPSEPNRTYAVQLYRDDNNGIFDPMINSVYVDFDTGARVVAYFTTTE